MRRITRASTVGAIVIAGLVAGAGIRLLVENATAQAAVHDARDMQMMTSEAGWIMTGTRLARTDDHGVTWRAITPSGVASSSIRAISFSDPSRGLLVVQGEISRSSRSSSLVAYRTSDGGSTWSSAAIGSTSYGFPVNLSMYVVSGTNAWVTWGLEGANSVAGSQLFRSADGGASWAAAASPINGLISGNASRLWLIGRRGGESRLYTSGDEGMTWTGSVAAAPSSHSGAAVVYDRVLSIDRNNAIASVSYAGSAKPGIGIFRTADGGGSWVPVADVPASSRVADQIAAPTSFVDSNSLVAVLPKGDVSYVLRSDGSSQRTATTGLVGGIFKISFATLSNGWAISHLDGPDQGRVHATQDGGRTWKELIP